MLTVDCHLVATPLVLPMCGFISLQTEVLRLCWNLWRGEDGEAMGMDVGCVPQFFLLLLLMMMLWFLCRFFHCMCTSHLLILYRMAKLRTWGWPNSRPRLITWLPLPSGAARCSDAAGPLFTYGERPCRKRQYKNGRCKDCVLAKYLLNRCLKFGVLTGDILVHLGCPFGWWCRNLLWAKHIESWAPCLRKVWSHQIDPGPVMFAQLVDLLMVESTC